MKYILLLLSIIFITGCAFDKPDPTPVNAKPPYNLTDDIMVPPPPDPNLYYKASSIERERMLTKYTIKLLKVIGKNNHKNELLKEWFEQIDKVYKKKR